MKKVAEKKFLWYHKNATILKALWNRNHRTIPVAADYELLKTSCKGQIVTSTFEANVPTAIGIIAMSFQTLFQTLTEA